MKPATLTPEAQAYYRLNQTLGIRATEARLIRDDLSFWGHHVVHIKVDSRCNCVLPSSTPLSAFIAQYGK